MHTWRQGRVCGDHQAGCLPSLDLHRRHGGSFEAGRSGDADADGPKKEERVYNVFKKLEKLQNVYGRRVWLVA